jgi:hypothetical protein
MKDINRSVMLSGNVTGSMIVSRVDRTWTWLGMSVPWSKGSSCGTSYSRSFFVESL